MLPKPAAQQLNLKSPFSFYAYALGFYLLK
ncbi:hypothetical protein X564_21070 [Pseudoalteromonas agarivorans]|nr:hypothetical protein X564_21070 [Pseudoalteromonas agarivorans]